MGNIIVTSRGITVTHPIAVGYFNQKTQTWQNITPSTNPPNTVINTTGGPVLAVDPKGRAVLAMSFLSGDVNVDYLNPS